MMLYRQKETEVIVRRDDISVPVAEITSGLYAPELSDLADMAILCSNVYGDEQISTINRWYLEDKHQIEFSPVRRFHLNMPGLKAQVFTNHETEPTKAAVVYRGTRFFSFDWYSNFDWLTRYVPFLRNTYTQTRDHIKEVTKYLKSTYGDKLEILSTGHSLGGGLAQQASYGSKDIHLCFAFAPSPVTGYWNVPKGDRSFNSKGSRVYRIWERREVLAYFRVLMKPGYVIQGKPNQNPEVIEIRLKSHQRGNIINRHSMYALAERLKFDTLEPK